MLKRKVSDVDPLPLHPEEETEKDCGLFRQLSCALVINLAALLQGASVSSSSVILHSLQEDLGCFNSTTSSPLLLFDFYLGFSFDFSVTAEEGSWVASTWVLAHLVSAPLAGFLSDRIGRRKALMIDTALFGLGFLILTLSSSMAWLILARLLLGCPLVSQVYLCEIVPPCRRGLAAAMYSTLHSLGFCLVLMLGSVLHWRLAMAVPAILSLPTLAGLYHLRESPAWLHRQDRGEEAREAIRFYRLHPVPDLMEDTENPPEIHLMEDRESESAMERLKSVLHTLSLQGKHFWKDFLFLSLLFLLLGWAGFSILSFYAIEIFQLSGSPISASHTSWVTSLTKIACSLASFYFLHRFSRKSLFLATASLISVSFLTLGLFTHLSNTSIIPANIATSLNFIPMVMVILAYIGYGLGYGVIPSLLAAERMPVSIRSTVVGILMTLEMSSTFLLSKLKPVLMELLGIEGLFTMFAGVVFLVIILTRVSLHTAQTHSLTQGGKAGSIGSV